MRVVFAAASAFAAVASAEDVHIVDQDATPWQNFFATDTTHDISELEQEMEFVDLEGGWYSRGNPKYSYLTDTYVSPFSMAKYQVTNRQYAQFLTSIYQDGVAYVEYASDVVTTRGKYSRVVYAGTGLLNEYELYKGLDADGHDEGMEARANAGYIEFDGREFHCIEEVDGMDDDSDHCDWPATFVTWSGARAFADYYGVYLPTEAEWDYAARGGQNLAYATDDGTCEVGNCNFNGRDLPKVYTPGEDGHPDVAAGHPVAVNDPNYAPNPFGIYHMSGNVEEWCNDYYVEDVELDMMPHVNPIGALAGSPDPMDTSYLFVYKGGGYNYYRGDCRNDVRNGGTPHIGPDHFGFRVVTRPDDHPGFNGIVDGAPDGSDREDEQKDLDTIDVDAAITGADEEDTEDAAVAAVATAGTEEEEEETTTEEVSSESSTGSSVAQVLVGGVSIVGVVAAVVAMKRKQQENSYDGFSPVRVV